MGWGKALIPTFRTTQAFELLSPHQCTEIVPKVGRATPDDRRNDVGRSPTYFPFGAGL